MSTPALPPARARRRRRETGSAIIYVMLAVSVLSVVAASLLLTNVTRYQTTSQSASWQEAIVGAEAGVDLAINELRKRVVTGPGVSFPLDSKTAGIQAGWTTTNPQTGRTYADYGHAFPSTGQPYQLASHGGEGNTAAQVRVFVDVPGCDTGANFAQPNDTSYISQLDNPGLRDPDGVDRSRWLYRVRSLGIAGVSGPARPNLNKYDNRLRHFSFFNDWRTGRAVLTPQTARLVEAVVRPQTGFRNALMADVQIDLSNVDVLINSYDSSKGNYSDLNQGNQGNLATNGQLINANKAVVNGNAMTNNGTVDNAQNVTGQQSSTFYQELPPITRASLNPAWDAVSNGGTINSNVTYTASPDPNSPTLVRLNGINLPDGGKVVNVVPPKTGTGQSYIKFYVQGDITTTGTSYINLDASVNAIFYFTGNMNLQGVGILNNSYLSSHLLLNGLQPPANGNGTLPTRTLTVATTQDFEGIVYAPNYDLNLALQAAPANGATTNPNQHQIDDLQHQIDNLNHEITDLQNDITNRQNRPIPLVGPASEDNNRHILENQAKIAADQTQITQLKQQQAVLINANAPTSSTADHLQGYNGIYGGFVARTITVANKTHVHYDETLRTAGPVNHYEVVNWFEDDLSRNSAGGPETFWW